MKKFFTLLICFNISSYAVAEESVDFSKHFAEISKLGTQQLCSLDGSPYSEALKTQGVPEVCERELSKAFKSCTSHLFENLNEIVVADESELKVLSNRLAKCALAKFKKTEIFGKLVSSGTKKTSYSMDFLKLSELTAPLIGGDVCQSEKFSHLFEGNDYQKDCEKFVSADFVKCAKEYKVKHHLDRVSSQKEVSKLMNKMRICAINSSFSEGSELFELLLKLSMEKS